ncbi:MAG: GAF domain-containing protein [Desulfobacteraceae bacterium]|nr:GAF domain-containing protein [Desulfobacteraceae bacterium]
MILPLKKTLSVTVALVTLLLAGMLALGIRQYQLQRHQQEIIGQSGQLLFQYSVIREHILESIVNGGPARLQPVSGEVEAFHADLARMMANPFVPDDYKLAFASQVDLPGLMLLLRNLQGETISSAESRHLNELTRNLGERLVLFDHMVLEHAKRQVIDFQTTVIGILALAVVGLTLLLFSGYRRLAKPLFLLLRQVREVREGKRQTLADSGSWHEVRTLAAATAELLGEIRRLEREGAGRQNLLQMSREVLKVLAADLGVDDLYLGMSKALLANPDYCLVWVGVPEREGEGLLPVAADGSTTMTGRECKECMAVLLSAAGEHDGGQDQALAALRNGGPVVRRNILAGLPKGPVKNTPLAEGEVSCAAVPMGGGEVLAVVNLYSLEPESFGLREIELLLLLAQLAAARIRAMGAREGDRLPAGEGADANLALEINNMCNGIINYAQLLTDELGHSMPPEQNLLLANIIKEGERIAALVGPLSVTGDK